MKTFIPAGGAIIPSTSAVNWNSIFSGVSSGWQTPENSRDTVVSTAFIAENLYVATGGAPGSGKSYTFTIRKNGVDTPLTVVISDAATSAIDTTHRVSFADGDTISIQCTPSGTPDPLTSTLYYIEAETYGSVFPIVGGSNSNANNAANNFFAPQAGLGASYATQAEAEQIVPIACTINKLRTRLNLSPGSGKSYDVTLYKNGSPTSITTNIADSATTGTDTTHSVSFSPGDTMSLLMSPNNTPTARSLRWSFECLPNIEGESFVSLANNAAPSTAATRYEQLTGRGAGGWSTPESSRTFVVPATTFKSIYALAETAPSTGKSWDITLRKNGSNTALTVNISGTNQTASATTDVSTSQGDLLAFQTLPTGTPATTNGMKIACKVYYAPPLTSMLQVF